jgi:hypothetical protein
MGERQADRDRREGRREGGIKEPEIETEKEKERERGRGRWEGRVSE